MREYTLVQIPMTTHKTHRIKLFGILFLFWIITSADLNNILGIPNPHSDIKHRLQLKRRIKTSWQFFGK